MSSRITYTLVGSPGHRELAGVCDDCGDESPEHEDAYTWGRGHKCL